MLSVHVDLERVSNQVRYAWIRETAKDSKKWLPEQPGYLQDDVTALIFQDLFGGDVFVAIVDDKFGRRRIYHNVLDGVIFDLTGQLNDATQEYMKVHRGSLMSVCQTRYALLKDRVYTCKIHSIAGYEIPYTVNDLYRHGIIDSNHPDILQFIEISLVEQVEGVYYSEEEECTD